MRIAQVAPLAEAVPPRLYGGTERVVSWLTEELVRQGQDVTLFASGDSRSSARLVRAVPEGLRLAGIRDHTPSTLTMLEEVRRRADEFDIIHFHIDLLQFPLFRELFPKCVTTLHGRLDLPDFHPLYRAFPEMPLVSISDDQRRPMPPVNWVSTIHHGLPEQLHRFRRGRGGYLAFLGRISPEKRPDRAIEIARRSRMPLKIAAKVDAVDRGYFEDTIRPLLDHPLVEFIGEIDDGRKGDFLGAAAALLFPIDWPEPFGLVMIEAMATGTPVIAWAAGSVPEVIDQGVSGIVVSSIEEAVEAAAEIHRLERGAVRECFDMRFTASRMAADYIETFENLRCGRQPVRKPALSNAFKGDPRGMDAPAGLPQPS
ncbi:glycosyltransferase family 4 protein [Bosea sp. (in: a-proteobacteria)]|uniref:glycosyltransferase family 4 protein n=1 Tax=Bosea sp. (in: a-proteobacteria) TaxID=1871050 RepID=UPI00260C8102|nr:glycosyltransferase family 4 protein [Bosea sp. (in: a-proteobacteria)]MCO5091196.1 glycosyltransferase family 4 protein [Bosea sp. (in: a-proteobacteria)]